MVKEPIAGRVKTRLARQIGVAHAVGFYRHNTAATVARVAHDPRWWSCLAIAPDAALAGRAWPAAIGRLAQGRGDLGARMQRLFDTLPPGPVIVIGTDVPAISPAHVWAAFRALGGNDAVLGPAPDGGYWLVGLKRFPKVLRPFRDVRWSSEHALADTRRNLQGARVAFIETLLDIDEVPDLMKAGAALGRRVVARRSS